MPPAYQGRQVWIWRTLTRKPLNSWHGEVGEIGRSGYAPPRNAARQPPTADVLQRRRLCGLPGTDGPVVSPARGGDLGLLSDAQSRPPDPGPLVGGRLAVGHRRG